MFTLIASTFCFLPTTISTYIVKASIYLIAIAVLILYIASIVVLSSFGSGHTTHASQLACLSICMAVCMYDGQLTALSVNSSDFKDRAVGPNKSSVPIPSCFHSTQCLSACLSVWWPSVNALNAVSTGFWGMIQYWLSIDTRPDTQSANILKLWANISHSLISYSFQRGLNAPWACDGAAASEPSGHFYKHHATHTIKYITNTR